MQCTHQWQHVCQELLRCGVGLGEREEQVSGERASALYLVEDGIVKEEEGDTTGIQDSLEGGRGRGEEEEGRGSGGRRKRGSSS